MAARIAEMLGSFAAGTICLSAFWTGIREWRQFLLKEQFESPPRWMVLWMNYGWLLALPWSIYELIHFLQHADLRSLFVAGFLGFCIFIGLASRRWASEKRGVHTQS